jgi:formate C-acetyltransferase
VTIGGQNLVSGQAMDAVNPLSYAILESYWPPAFYSQT